MHAAPLVALVGNPNAGKSALFNALTGARQKVGNYPGVTVERKAGRFALDDGRPVELVDLPGAYSLDPASPDERVTRNVVMGAQAGERRPDAIVCVVDASNLDNHLRFTLQLIALGLPVVVALNRFTSDTGAELAAVRAAMASHAVEVVECDHWALGSAGAEDLARAVVQVLEAGKARFRPIYPDTMELAEKLRTVARDIYHADDIVLSPGSAKRLAGFAATGFGHLPVCIAKTQYSFSADPKRLGAPTGHLLPIREVRLSAGAGFVVAVCGDVMTMPGLPRHPAAESITLDGSGAVLGLF